MITVKNLETGEVKEVNFPDYGLPNPKKGDVISIYGAKVEVIAAGSSFWKTKEEMDAAP